MSEAKKCPKCGGEMERRTLRAGGGGYFVGLSDSDSVWRMGRHERIVGFMCQGCGFVEFYRDVRKKKERAPEPTRSLVR